jgi:hypothetical protein
VPLSLASLDRPANILRKLDDKLYIRYPVKAIYDYDKIDTDDVLLTAVAYFTNSIIEQQKKGTHLNAYEKEIMRNNERLIETELTYCDTEGGPLGSRPYV